MKMEKTENELFKFLGNFGQCYNALLLVWLKENSLPSMYKRTKQKGW